MKLFTTLAAIAVTVTLSAQSFSSPESVEYDAVGQRWFVGQNGSGLIHVYSPASGTLIPFASGLTSGPHGLEIMGNVLYACDGGRIRGFDLTTGTQVFNLNLSATFLNGLTTDGSTYLFATDYSAKKIYRICPSTNTYNVMCTIVKSPNGIYYDGPNNRLVYVTGGSAAPVQATLLSDSTYSTILSTTMGSCDGITRDGAGYWYVTAWTGQQLWRIDPNFSSAPVSVMTGLSSPADIDINAAGDSIGIPNSGSANNVVFYTGITTNISFVNQAEDGNAFPNPSSGAMTIVIKQNVVNGTCDVYDLGGKLISSQQFSGDRCVLPEGDLPAGTYLVRMREGEAVLFEGKVVLAPAK